MKLQEYITKNPIVSLLLTLLSAYLAKKIITRQEVLPLAIPTPTPTTLCPNCINSQPSNDEHISIPTPTPSIISLESDTRNHQPRLRQRVVVKTVAQPRVIAEMGQSLSQLAVIEKVRSNQWHLSAGMEDGSSYHLGMITNIKGKIFMMPAHFYVFLHDKQPLTVTMTPANNDKLQITKNYDNWITGEVIAFNESNDPTQKRVQFPMDICVFCLDQMPRGKSILHHFASDEDLAKLYNSSFHGTLSGMDIVEDKPILTNMGGNCNIQFAEIIVNMPDHLDSFRAAFLVRYDIPTKVGDCGKILTINSDKVAGRILGFHISGSKDPGRNYSQVVSRSTIEKALALLPNFAQINCGLRDLPPAEKPFETGLITRGQANFTIPQVSKTSIVPSALYGEFNTPLTRPARLRPWKQVVDGQIIQRDPLRETAAKQGRQCGNLPKATIEVIECSMQQLILPRRVASTEVRLLTYEESVRGIEGDPLFQPINRLTSPGYPYVLDPRKKGKGKTFWMGSMEWDFTSPQAIELRHDVEKLEEDLLTDQPHEIIWVDTLKDERRSHAKVDAGKTRLISNGPMHYNILFRKYFMGALAHIRANRIDNGVAVGINVWGPEWHALAMYLQGTSDEMIDGDMTDFSDRLMDDLTWVNFRLFNKIYETYDYDYHDDHRRVRERLWEYATCAIRYNQGTIYQTTNGTPAGFVPTAENNSLYGLCAFRAAYIYLAHKYKPELNDLKHFEENVRVITYGDDNVLSIHPKLKEFFNMRNLVEAFDSFGMVYTTANKDTDYDTRKTISDVSFLKRRFALVRIKNVLFPRFVCPAPLDTRIDMLNWTSSKHVDNLLEQSDTVTDVFKELAMHPQDVFDHWTQRIAKRCYELGINDFRLLPYSQYLEPFATGGKFVVTHTRDLTVARQKSEFNKSDSTAVCGRGECIHTYTLGSPEAAPKYPREIRSCSGLSHPEH